MQIMQSAVESIEAGRVGVMQVATKHADCERQVGAGAHSKIIKGCDARAIQFHKRRIGGGRGITVRPVFDHGGGDWARGFAGHLTCIKKNGNGLFLINCECASVANFGSGYLHTKYER